MTAFEFTFGLISLLLGLGFAHLAQSFAKLVMAGPRVKWDWLSPLAALQVFALGLIYWWFQFGGRDESVVLGTIAIRASACLALYMMAVAALPEPDRNEEIDLKSHFERSRRLYYACFLAYAFIVTLLPQLNALVRGEDLPWAFNLSEYATFALLGIGLAVANRWVQLWVLLLLLVGSTYGWVYAALQ